LSKIAVTMVGNYDLSRVKGIYYAVRDRVLYDPYQVYAHDDAYSARVALERGRGFCIAKAALLAACARAVEIPARLGFADVRNHLATPRLIEMNGSETFRESCARVLEAESFCGGDFASEAGSGAG
jgi:transglutaminase-like putative cysteine protease